MNPDTGNKQYLGNKDNLGSHKQSIHFFWKGGLRLFYSQINDAAHEGNSNPACSFFSLVRETNTVSFL